MAEAARRLPDLSRVGNKTYSLEIVPPAGMDPATRDDLVSGVSTGFINRQKIGRAHV